MSIVTLAFGILSPLAYSSVDGVFSGTVTTDLSCFTPPVPGGFPEPTDISISLSTGPSGGIVNSVSMSSPHFIFTSSSAGSYFDNPPNPDGSINLAGSISGDMTVTFDDVDVDGSYSGASFFFEAIFNTDNTLELVVSTDISFSGSPCSDGDVAFSLPATLTGAGGAGGAIVNPEITPSSTITEAVLFNTQIQRTVTDISRHITGAVGGGRYFWRPRIRDDQFTLEGATGLNAGDGSTVPYGVWGSYSYTDFDNDLSSTAFDGNSHSFLGGLDFAFWENTVLGVAFGYDNGDIDTTFNLGHQDADSYTIAPYFGALLSDNLSIDFNVGYSRVEYDQFRTLPGTTTRVTSSPDADRWFGALNLNGVVYYDNWILGARVGALYAKSVVDSFTESDGTVIAQTRNKVGEGSIAGDVAYTLQNFEPFLNVSYQYDFELTKLTVTTVPQLSHDRDDVLMRVGIRYFDNNGITGNLEYSKRFDRDDFDEDRISLTLRIDF